MSTNWRCRRVGAPIRSNELTAAFPEYCDDPLGIVGVHLIFPIRNGRHYSDRILGALHRDDLIQIHKHVAFARSEIDKELFHLQGCSFVLIHNVACTLQAFPNQLEAVLSEIISQEITGPQLRSESSRGNRLIRRRFQKLRKDYDAYSRAPRFQNPGLVGIPVAAIHPPSDLETCGGS